VCRNVVFIITKTAPSKRLYKKTTQMGRDGIEPFFATHCDNSNLRYSEISGGTKCVTLLDNPTLTADDQMALGAIISAWPTLAPETKIGILQAIEAERLAGC
jgi:hypothetical protein